MTFRQREMIREDPPFPSPSSAPEDVMETAEIKKPALMRVSACPPRRMVSGLLLNSPISCSGMARQMPVSLYGISLILQEEGVSCEYIGDFEDKAAEKQMMEHLYKGKPVIIETSRMRRKGKRIVHFFDKKYAGSYHTMILLGVDEEGQIVFTDSATRDWAGEQQRLKRAKLPELISYMFPQKNVGDTHLYFSRKRNTGGYILIR